MKSKEEARFQFGFKHEKGGGDIMPHATYPVVFWDNNHDVWKCNMKDKKTGRIWGHGYGSSRDEAIIKARHDQPGDTIIKRSIDWESTA